jgi:hypothetical protein
VCVGAQSITGATFLHWLAVSERTEGRPPAGQPAPSATQLRHQVLVFLISSDWGAR